MSQSVDEIERLLPERPPLAGRGYTEIKVVLKTVTPILGGGVKTREVDAFEILRPSAIRSHLRFWWRALMGHESQFDSPQKLYAAEATLWGKAGDDGGGGRSIVEIDVRPIWNTHKIGGDEKPDGRIGARDDNFYALWPAQGQTPAERYPAGVEVALRLTCPAQHQDIVERALRAWILFGGYGGRTRRGVGSLTCANGEWLPGLSNVGTEQELAAQINGLLSGKEGRDVYFGRSGTPSRSFPLLAGASLIVAGERKERTRLIPFNDAERAWHTALHWLRDFRQGADFARDPRPERDNNPPGRSRWPEADKIRHLTKHVHYRKPQHSRTPAWPRAGFGLPIGGQFKPADVDRGDPRGRFEITWVERNGNSFEARNRMASPLIVKPLPVKGGGFLACALWLSREYPLGEVWLARRINGKKILIVDSNAPFDRLIAPDDTSLISAIDKTTPSLRHAFLDWASKKQNVWRVA